MKSTGVDPAAVCDLSSSDALLFTRYGIGERRLSPFGCIHHAFEHFATSQPHSVAAEHCGTSITYGELNQKSNALAHRLRALGVVPGTRVCLLVQRSVSMVIGILAILKAGAAYVPLDGSIVTQSTLEHVLQDSRSILTLVLQEYLHRVTDYPNVCLDEAIANISSENSTKPEDLSFPDDSAYIIYTSGELIGQGAGSCVFNVRRHDRKTKGGRSNASQRNEP